MEQLISSIQYTIPGFIYCCARFFGTMLCVGNIKLSIVTNVGSEYFPLIAIIIVFASYAIGFAVNNILSKIISYIKKDDKFEPSRLIEIQKMNTQTYKGLSYSYQNLIMLRNLVVSVGLLTIILILRFCHTEYWKYPLALGGILLAIFEFAYCTQKNLIKDLNDGIDKLLKEEKKE
jgi:hypothetical protein